MPHRDMHHSAAVAERAAIVKLVEELATAKRSNKTPITDVDLTTLVTAIKDRAKLSPTGGQHSVDPATGQPYVKDKIDPNTGKPYSKSSNC